METTLIVLSIIKLMLEIASKQVEHMTPEQWTRFEGHVDQFMKMLDKLPTIVKE